MSRNMKTQKHGARLIPEETSTGEIVYRTEMFRKRPGRKNKSKQGRGKHTRKYGTGSNRPMTRRDESEALQSSS